MLRNLSEDYVLHMQQHQNLWMELLCAVPSYLESVCMYAHTGMLEDSTHRYRHPTSGEMIKFFKVEREDVASLLMKLGGGVSSDVEGFPLACQSTIEFVHIDGEMFEVIPSSIPDSPSEKQDSLSDVKEDITKKRKAVLADVGSNADIADSDKGLHYFESGLSASIRPEMVLLQNPRVADLCSCLTAKAVQDPFVRASESYFDDRYILRDDFIIYPVSTCTISNVPAITPEKWQVHTKDFNLEEAVCCDTVTWHALRESCERIERMSCIDDPLQNFLQAVKLSKQDSTSEALPTGFLETVTAEEVTFMELNTEGLSEIGDQTSFALEVAAGTQPFCIHSMTANRRCHLSKWNLPDEEQLKFYSDTELTERNILETEENFLEIFTLRLPVENTREQSIRASVVAEAIHYIRRTYDDQQVHRHVDQTLPWDPVAQSSVSVSAWNHSSMEPLHDHDENRAPRKTEYQVEDNTAPQKFILPQSLFVGQERSIFQSQPCKSQTAIYVGSTDNRLCVETKQTPANSLQDFMFLRRNERVDTVK